MAVIHQNFVLNQLDFFPDELIDLPKELLQGIVIQSVLLVQNFHQSFGVRAHDKLSDLTDFLTDWTNVIDVIFVVQNAIGTQLFEAVLQRANEFDLFGLVSLAKDWLAGCLVFELPLSFGYSFEYFFRSGRFHL